MEFNIREPILFNGCGQSFMYQPPFKIYRADFKLEDGLLCIRYYYNSVNRKYKHRFTPSPQMKPPLLELFDKNMSDCGILELKLGEDTPSCGLWVLKRFLNINSAVKIPTGKYQILSGSFRRFKFENDSMIYSGRKEDTSLTIRQLDVSVQIINHTTLIGFGSIRGNTNSPDIRPVTEHRYSKAKKALKKLFEDSMYSPYAAAWTLESAITESYNKVSIDSKKWFNETKPVYK